jgi:UDP-N-acetylglucosamine 2-epimerase (non-hydrolysing)
MQTGQSLGDFTARAVRSLNDYLATEKTDMVLVQGDTTTVFCGALASFYNRIPVGHVEAGLRTGNLYSPWPEEANRVLTSHLSTLHFAPTETSKLNLLKEGVASDRIFVTGNTVIDALMLAVDRIKSNPPEVPGLPTSFTADENGFPMVLITGHRRENFGPGFESICQAISDLAEHFPKTQFVYPVHLNPEVREPVLRIIGQGLKKNIHLIEPVSYLSFVSLMYRAKLILTDSGGIQEEAPSLGKPVLVMRETTERPEALISGVAKLVGTDRRVIVSEVTKLLSDDSAYHAMAKAVNPYGDGNASQRILDVCRKLFSENGMIR